MGAPVQVGRVCALCGEQVTLHIDTDGGTYTEDLGALMQAKPGDIVVVEAHCGCATPRSVAFKATPSAR